MNDAPEFPDYEVVTSEELDAMSDEDAVELARRVQAMRVQWCHKCGGQKGGVRSVYAIGTEDDVKFGLCEKHGKRLYRRLNPPKMAVPKGRR